MFITVKPKLDFYYYSRNKRTICHLETITWLRQQCLDGDHRTTQSSYNCGELHTMEPRIDRTKLDNSAKAVHRAYWKWHIFALLYRSKSRAFGVSLTLEGHLRSNSLLFLLVLIASSIYACSLFHSARNAADECSGNALHWKISLTTRKIHTKKKTATKILIFKTTLKKKDGTRKKKIKICLKETLTKKATPSKPKGDSSWRWLWRKHPLLVCHLLSLTMEPQCPQWISIFHSCSRYTMNSLIRWWNWVVGANSSKVVLPHRYHFWWWRR